MQRHKNIQNIIKTKGLRQCGQNKDCDLIQFN